MGVWGYILLFAVGIAAFIIIMSLLFNLIVAWAARHYSDKTLNKSLTALEKQLPGKNCGECGCETCAEYARAVFTCRMDTDRCTIGDPELPKRLDACMAAFEKRMEWENERTNSH